MLLAKIFSIKKAMAYILLGMVAFPCMAESKRLTLTGSSTVAPLMLEIGKRYEQLHPGVQVDVQSGGSSRGIADVRSGVADIGLVSRALKADETDLQAYTIAIDGISIILHATNPVTQLSDAQIKAIYTGQITRWKDVGGQDAPIVVVNKAEGRSTLELFLAYFGLKNREIKAQVIVAENQQDIKTIAGNPFAIGYVSIGAAEYEIVQGTSIKLLPIAGITANTLTVSDRSFPLSRPLNLVSQAQPSALAKDLIDFAQSAAVNDLIKAQFFVPVAR